MITDAIEGYLEVAGEEEIKKTKKAKAA